MQVEFLDIIQTNRETATKLELDTWIQEQLKIHLGNIRRHCMDISSGKIAMPDGHYLLMIRIDPTHPAIGPLWVEFIDETHDRFEATVTSIREFLKTTGLKSFGNTSYHDIFDAADRKLQGMIGVGCRLQELTLALVDETLDYGMRYQPFTEEDMCVISNVLENIQNADGSLEQSAALRQESIEILRCARRVFSNDRLKPLQARYEEIIPKSQYPRPRHIITDGNESSEESKRQLINHIFYIEHHVLSIWRELFYSMEYCLTAQNTCFYWVDSMMKEYRATIETIRKIKKSPDVRHYIDMKEKRAGGSLLS
ncbi:hypothetical protein TWF696_007498 [Orbilia brochopaga]|uniref:Uncharacterized protein n=1 Tax=Orbilia brochopaga TaxID=3140254 RepID=A0AAV9UKJ8_9PEZI